MHVVMPQRVVVHLHAIEALAVLVRADAPATLRTRCRDRFRWEWVEYRQPGAKLARSVAVVLGRTLDANVVFLQNHGILVGGDTIDEIDRRITGLVSALKQDVAFSESASQPIHKSPTHCTSAHWSMSLLKTCGFRAWSTLRRSTEDCWKPGCSIRSCRLSGRESRRIRDPARGSEIRWRRRPPLLFIRGEGVFTKPDFDQAQRAQLLCYYEVLARQRPQDVLVELTEKDVHDLLHWEAEQYRVNVGSAKDPSTSKGGNGTNVGRENSTWHSETKAGLCGQAPY